MSSVPPTPPPRATAPKGGSGKFIIGALAASAVGYYFYQSGGNAKDAKLKAEADFHKATGRGPGEAERTLEKAGSEIDKFDHAAKQKAEEIKSGVQEKREAVNKTIDDVDRAVENKAAEVKSKSKGWFGF